MYSLAKNKTGYTVYGKTDEVKLFLNGNSDLLWSIEHFDTLIELEIFLKNNNINRLKWVINLLEMCE
ncbi:hypothetical protein LCL95_00810 [Bacillus timonensis]|nr:hypothetical protein [Bacillus timonensis]